MRISHAALFVSVVGGAIGAPVALGQFTPDPAENTLIVSRPGDQTLPKVAEAGDGGFWVTWFDIASGNYDVYAQRYDQWGLALFPAGGAPISTLTQPSSLVDYGIGVDAFGDAYVAFTDAANGSDRDARLTKVARSNGAVAWSLALSNDTAFEADPRVVELATGVPRVVATWPRTDGAVGIHACVVESLTGTPEQPLNGVRIAGDGVEEPAFHEMISSEDGGFVMVYARDTRTFASPRHVHVQKYSAALAPLWNGGAPVIVSNQAVPIAFRPRIVSTGFGGGCVIAWHDGRTGGTSVYVQRLDSNGAALWTANGLGVSGDASRLRFDPAVVFDAASGDTMVFWSERTGSQNQRGIYAQRVDTGGSLQLGPNGTEILPVDADVEEFIRAVPAAGGGAIVIYTRVTGGGNSEVMAVRVNSSGDIVWGPATLSNVASSKGRLPVAVNACGRAVAVWEDGRNAGMGADLYMQNIDADGTLGVGAGPADLNKDGVVGASDLAGLLGSWGPCGACCPADLNGDGVVGAGDLAALLGSWG